MPILQIVLLKEFSQRNDKINLSGERRGSRQNERQIDWLFPSSSQIHRSILKEVWSHMTYPQNVFFCLNAIDVIGSNGNKTDE